MTTRLRTIGYVLAGLLPFYCLVIFVLTHIPLPVDIHKSDKLAHFAAYLVLGGLVSIGLGLRWRGQWFVPFIAVAACAAYGALDEYTQQFVNRSTDLVDWFADLAGATVGATLYYGFMRRYEQAKR